MALPSSTQPLGTVLQQAGLVSAAQVSLALQEQTINQHRLGDLLCEHGWLHKPTAHFFAEQWPTLFHDPDPLPLGQYLHQAHLLTDTQIDYLLEQQNLTQLKFGVLAVANGWIKLQTLNFFLTHLHHQDTAQSQPSETNQTINFNTPEYWQHLREYLLENELANPYSLLQIYEQILTHYDLPFTGDLEQTALLNLGLVTLRNNRLIIAHPLFRSIFNTEWIQRERNRLHPYDKIRLQFLNLSKAGAYPYRLLEAILTWTNNHSVLNQKVAHLVRTGSFVEAGEESAVVEQLVQNKIIHDWRSGFATKHLSSIEEQVLQNSNCDPIDLLTYYQVVWHQLQAPSLQGEEEAELLRLGLLIQDGQQVKVANQIYRLVFDQTWLEQQISHILNPLGNEDSTPTETVAEEVPLHSEHPPVVKYAAGPIRRSWKFIGILLLGGLGIGSAIWALSRHRQLQTELVPSPEQDVQSLDNQPSASPESPAPSPHAEERPSSLPTELDPSPEQDVQSLDNQPSTSLESLAPSTHTEKRPSSLPKPTPTPIESTPPNASGGVVLVTENSSVPVFSVGVTDSDIQTALGPPTLKSPGYWPNSYGLLYKNLQPHETDFGFLLDADTQRLRQTEAAFAQSAGLNTLRLALQGMLKDRPPSAVMEQLTLIYQRQAQEYEFQVNGLKGIIQRNEKDRIYIGVWEADFH